MQFPLEATSYILSKLLSNRMFVRLLVRFSALHPSFRLLSTDRATSGVWKNTGKRLFEALCIMTPWVAHGMHLKYDFTLRQTEVSVHYHWWLVALTREVGRARRRHRGSGPGDPPGPMPTYPSAGLGDSGSIPPYLVLGYILETAALETK